MFDPLSRLPLHGVNTPISAVLLFVAWLSDAVYTKELGVVYNLAPYAYKVTVNFPVTFSQSQGTGRGFSVASLPGLETRLVV